MEACSCLFFATSHLFLNPPCRTALCSSIFPSSSFFPHFPLSRSLTLLSTSHFSFPEMRGCIHGNKAEVGGLDGGEDRAASLVACCSIANKQWKQVISTASKIYLMDLQKNYQWPISSKLFYCTNGMLSLRWWEAFLFQLFSLTLVKSWVWFNHLELFCLQKGEFSLVSLLVCLLYVRLST